MYMSISDEIVHKFEDSDGETITVEHSDGSVVLTMTSADGEKQITVILPLELAERFGNAVNECGELAAEWLRDLEDEESDLAD